MCDTLSLHDALPIYDNVKGNYGVIKKTGKTFIPFSPSQIKSATGNSGAFSKATANINGSSAVPILGLTAGVSGGGLAAALIAKRKLDEMRRRK
jgi:hypothetical protein